MGWRYFWQPDKGRLLVHIGAFALLWPAINWAYLVAIPQYFLTESEARAEIVVRARDGKEMFRGAMPRFTRNRVAFPGQGFFAYAERDGSSRTRVER